MIIINVFLEMYMPHIFYDKKYIVVHLVLFDILITYFEFTRLEFLLVETFWNCLLVCWVIKNMISLVLRFVR